MAAYRLMGIHIGKGVSIGPDCYLDDTFPELIYIDDNVTMSVRVMLGSHGDTSYSSRLAPVFIQKGAYIGAGAIILPGVEIGEKAKVGAGAVVTRGVPPGAMVVGGPARAVPRMRA